MQRENSIIRLSEITLLITQRVRVTAGKEHGGAAGKDRELKSHQAEENTMTLCDSEKGRE